MAKKHKVWYKLEWVAQVLGLWGWEIGITLKGGLYLLLPVRNRGTNGSSTLRNLEYANLLKLMIYTMELIYESKL